MERLYTSNDSVINGNIKCPIGRSIFGINLPLKLFRATVGHADTKTLKFFQTLITYMDLMLAKFEPSRVVQKVQNFEFLIKHQNF